MRLFVPGQTDPEETRAAILPMHAKELVELGAQVEVEAGIGRSIDVSDIEYEEAGVRVSRDHQASLMHAEMILEITAPRGQDIPHLSEGCVHVSCASPFDRVELVKSLAAQKVSAISLAMVPRTAAAQKMDVLSSQANLAGYAAVLLAADRQKIILPMMMTPAGTIPPARVFVVGAGVAGLQAIATAKRLGARVVAFDVRPEAQDQILSLGAKPLNVDLGATEQTKGGYAKSLTDEQLQKQRRAMAEQCAQSDVVITTARVFGRKAPLIITNQMLDGMKPGSVVVDLAIEAGGNVEASELGKEILRKGVTIIGLPELQRRVPVTASRMLSSNLCSFVSHFWDKQAGRFVLGRDDEIIQSCLITHDGQIVNPLLKAAIG